MRIFPAEVVETGGRVRITYRFDTRAQLDIPNELWFEVGEEFRPWIFAEAETGIATLALLAMALGEDVEVSAPVSPRFQYFFRDFVAHFNLWLPQLKRISLAAPAGPRPERPRGDAVVTCFSGGVDSFFTIHEHLGPAAPHPSFRLSHLFFAHGFDIPLHDSSYDVFASEFAGLARGWGLKLIRLSSNARHLLDPYVHWVTAHGACIAACALLLSGGIRTFIVPSTNRQSLLFSPCGSNPITDPMLGTEALEIVHHGGHFSRIQKILAISAWADVHNYLRVCWQNAPGKKNCGRCVKCLKTMMPLEIAGVLGKFSVFPRLPPWNEIPAECFAPLDLSRYAPELSYAAELRALAVARGYRGMPPA